MLRFGIGLVLAMVVGCGDSQQTSAAAGGRGGGGAGGAGGDGTGGDAAGGSGAGGGGGSSPCDIGEPLTVPEDTWSYIEVQAAACGAAGTTAGFFVNPTASSKRLLIFFQGGGACFQQNDCQAANLNGFDPGQIQNLLAQHALFNRALASNPFSDFSYVFIPYCTGDFHAGNNTASYGLQHVGYDNVGRYLERVVPTFCDAEYVMVTGTSAGGFGATFNYDRIHRLFGATPVDLVDDSGPYLRPPYMPSDMQAAVDDNWGFRANMPSGCSACTSAWHELYSHAATAWPDDRQSLISSLRDPSIQGRFSVYSTALATLDDFELGIDDLADQVIVPLASARVFYIGTQGHVWINAPLDQTVTSGVSLETFLRQQIGDDPAWANVRP